MRRRTCCMADAKPMGSGSLAGRIERRRVGGDCRGHVGGGIGQRQRRLGARARALYRHLFAQTNTRTNSGRGHLPPCVGPFAILGAIGPMARTIGDVALMFRALSGQDPLDPVSPPVVLRDSEPGRVARRSVFRGRWPRARDAGDACCGATRRRGASRAGFRVEPFARARWSRCASCGGRFLSNAEQCSTSRRFAASEIG